MMRGRQEGGRINRKEISGSHTHRINQNFIQDKLRPWGIVRHINKEIKYKYIFIFFLFLNRPLRHTEAILVFYIIVQSKIVTKGEGGKNF